MRGSAEAGGQGRSGPAESLQLRVLESLRRQGFQFDGQGRLGSPGDDKEAIRSLHREALRARIERAREGLARHEDRLLTYIANGAQIEPNSIRPVLREVRAKTEDELLFRYARLHWSIPVSPGYGRRLRFLVFDEQNQKLIGLFGLGDPVFALGPRDRWIGWDRQARVARLRNVMDAFVVGAVPPYSHLLAGKLVAMLMTSREVADAFAQKYSTGTALISRRASDGRLALITTASALGRSSLYNRLAFHDRKLFLSCGFTLGSGEFHFSNGVYQDLMAFARYHHVPTAKHEQWGTGWRSRREVIRKVLPQLGLSRDLIYHGVRREIFLVPLAGNSSQFLRGEDSDLDTFRTPVQELVDWYRQRWLLPRAATDLRYREFASASYRLWPSHGTPLLARLEEGD